MKRALFLFAALIAPVAAPAQTPAAPAEADKGDQGIVSAADPRAVAAGVEILREGGSSVDAAIATMLALNVVEPYNSGIGGGSFLLHSDGKIGTTTSFDGRETAPHAATDTWFYDKDGKPLTHAEAVPGGRSVGVPGDLRMWAEAHERFGRLAWAKLFEPAIRLARGGFVITPRLYRAFVMGGDHIEADAKKIFTDADGNWLPVGTWLQNPAQADLLQSIADRGADSFYVGPVAQQIVNKVNNAARNPSKMTLGDLASYQAKQRDPVCEPYRSYRICSMGPPSSGGITVLMILKQLERFDLHKMGVNSPVAWHLFAESQRLAFADRNRYIGDPDYVHVPVKGMLNPAYLAKRSQLISPDTTLGTYEPGTPAGAPKRITAPQSEVPGTSHIATADQWGNVTSVTSTIEGYWGSGLAVQGTFLNNELTDFDIVPTEDGYLVANRVEGGKRPRSSMSPTIVYGPDGKVRLVVGAAGGPTIIGQVAKAIMGVIDFDMSAQQAIATGLIFAPSAGGYAEADTQFDAMMPALEKLGENLKLAPLGVKANAIERVDGHWVGAADPRSEGVAMTEDGKVTKIVRAGTDKNRPAE
ncbi:gamma-glutamyltransferase [Stakelama pacifica]|uniref:Glutathione hydrolase proenzyme n=1 Tax=Stakelama pacifica TaxID=517720 RepID=A0A4R6FPQ6_9SPHN|nr:gamma-glutamyltransferase [Stakelama pacifica]TDN83666.1 gamma-glutamyltranspeptidase/glutathione hydrolase [Stakelama pacifica]GGO94468.1 gamma-glutamyltransferase [Stakelama pacifica]